MAGDRNTESTQATPEQSGGSSFWNHPWVDKFKHGAAAIGHKASELGHKGLEEGKKIASHPTTKRIEGEVIAVGKEIGNEHLRQIHGAAEAGKAGDIQGVLRNGMPLAKEAVLSPEALALKLAQDKGARLALQHAQGMQPHPPKHDVSGKNAHPALPHLTLDGVSTGDHGENKR
jgi:hypothetical protein